MWGNLYNLCRVMESIPIATSLEWADAGRRHYEKTLATVIL
jgi:hypothetical protein